MQKRKARGSFRAAKYAHLRRWHPGLVDEESRLGTARNRGLYDFEENLPQEQIAWQCPRCPLALSKAKRAEMTRRVYTKARWNHLNTVHPGQVSNKQFRALGKVAEFSDPARRLRFSRDLLARRIARDLLVTRSWPQDWHRLRTISHVALVRDLTRTPYSVSTMFFCIM